MSVNRTTFNVSLIQMQEHLRTSQALYEEATIPASTGKKINTLSDSAAGTNKVISLKNLSQQVDQFQKNLSSVKLRLQFTESQLTSSADVLNSVKELAIQSNNASTSDQERSAISTQIDTLRDQLLSLANQKFDNKYVFSGSATNVKPFIESSGSIVFNTAGGANSTEILVNTAFDIDIAINVDGNEIFSGDGGGVDVFSLLDDLQAHIESGDSDAVGDDLDSLATASDQIQSAISTVGSRQRYLDQLEERLSNDALRYITSLAEVQDAPLEQVYPNLINQETALKLIYASSSRVFDTMSQLQQSLMR